MDKIIYSCSGHIDELLDVFLNEICEMPLLEEIIGAERECHKCHAQALYKLLRSEVKVKWE